MKTLFLFETQLASRWGISTKRCNVGEWMAEAPGISSFPRRLFIPSKTYWTLKTILYTYPFRHQQNIRLPRRGPVQLSIIFINPITKSRIELFINVFKNFFKWKIFFRK